MIKNLNEALSPLSSLLHGVKQAKKTAEFTVATRILEDAASAAPGSLGSKIFIRQEDEETIIDAGDDLSAYVEFGTGTTNVEANLALFGNDPMMISEAEKFIQTRLGRGLAHPFFFPAIYRHQEEITEELNNELAKL